MVAGCGQRGEEGDLGEGGGGSLKGSGHYWLSAWRQAGRAQTSWVRGQKRSVVGVKRSQRIPTEAEYTGINHLFLLFPIDSRSEAHHRSNPIQMTSPIHLNLLK